MIITVFESKGKPHPAGLSRAMGSSQMIKLAKYWSKTRHFGEVLLRPTSCDPRVFSGLGLQQHVPAEEQLVKTWRQCNHAEFNNSLSCRKCLPSSVKG